MARRYYYLTAALPTLGELGVPPPMGLPQLMETVEAGGGPVELVRALLLGHDLLLREAVISGQLQDAAPAVLSPAQLHDKAALPPEIVAESDRPLRVAADATWAGYFHYAAAVARRAGSEFLAAWVGFEVALRNALAVARAEALGLEAAQYVVAPELADSVSRFESILNEWKNAPDAVAALKALDAARWDWLAEHDAWFSFEADEIVAYAAKLVLLHRWATLTPVK